jgi:hypothetical protein
MPRRNMEYFTYIIPGSAVNLWSWVPAGGLTVGAAGAPV